ncbi:MAG: CpaF family protein [Acidimicrobiia bacterium]
MSTLIDDAVHAAYVREGGDDVATVVRAIAGRLAPLLPPIELSALVERVVARVNGFGPIDAALRDPDVTDVMVTAGRDVWIERGGRIERLAEPTTPAVVEQLIERIIAPLGLRVDRTHPYADARLPDGSRVHAIVPPLAIDGPCLTVRRFAAKQIPLSAFCSTAVEGLLRGAVDGRANIVVAGRTGSGKTTLLNALGAAVDPGERVVTIEDAAELRLPGEHVVRLEARPSADGVETVTIRDLVRAALRMRPDRIVVGEVRGAEALDMVQALNTGHDGSLSTCHANSSIDALRRIETMMLMAGLGLPLDAVREQVAASIDLVVFVTRHRDGRRRVDHVVELTDDGDRVRMLARGDELTGGAPTRWRSS